MSEIRGENSLRLLRRGLGVQGSFSRAKDALFQDDNERWNLEVLDICTSRFPSELLAPGGVGGCDLIEGDAGGNVVACHDFLHVPHILIDVVAFALACVIDPL
jgi:hypothetical protein